MRGLWKPEDEQHNPKFQIQTLAGRMYVLTGKAKVRESFIVRVTKPRNWAT